MKITTKPTGPERIPAVGDAVLYTLSEFDAHRIHKQRMRVPARYREGNPAYAGQRYPAVIVCAGTSEDTASNIQVFLDGSPGVYYAGSRAKGEGHHRWQWNMP